MSSPLMKANLLAYNFTKAHDNALESDAVTTAAVANSIASINESPKMFEAFFVRSNEVTR